MLKRLLRLRENVRIFQKEYNCLHLIFTAEEWKQMEYLINFDRSFMIFIKIISKISDSTIQNSFKMYDTLFDHIETATDKLHLKQRKWKTKL
jgi:hypothetical protein